MNKKLITTPWGGRRGASMNGGIIITVVVIIIVVGLGWAYFKKNNPSAYQPAVNSEPIVMQNALEPGALAGNPADAAEEAPIKIYNIDSVNFKFSLTEISVKKGDRVRINLRVTDGFHDWVVDEFNAKTKQIAIGQTDSVEFTASRAGTFEYYCSVGTHRQMGMVGKLIVSE